MAKGDYKKFKSAHSAEYYRMVGRSVRQMEKEVTKLLTNHHGLSIDVAWDIASDAHRQADRIVTGGYVRE